MSYQQHMSWTHHKALRAERLSGPLYATPTPLYQLYIRHYNRQVCSSIYQGSEVKKTWSEKN